MSPQKGTHLNDNDSDDSTGGWIPFWSGDSSDQKTGTQIKPEQISWKIGRLEQISHITKQQHKKPMTTVPKHLMELALGVGQNIYTSTSMYWEYYQHKSREPCSLQAPLRCLM